MSVLPPAQLPGAAATITVGDIDINYLEAGSGDAIVLLHGGIMDHESWEFQIPALASKYRVIAPDTRGHGHSTGARTALSFDIFAADVIGLIEALSLSRVHLVGFSDGGCTALKVALARPDLVDRVILVGTPYDISSYPPGTAELLGGVTPEQLYGMFGVDSEFVRVVKKAEAKFPDAESWDAFWRNLVNGLWTREPRMDLSELEDFVPPTLIVHAANEQLYSLESSQDMERTIPVSELVIVEDSTHTSPLEQPEVINRLILDFLAREV